MIDLYCERLTPDFWAEPINALTNVSFLIAAYAIMRLSIKRKIDSPDAWMLIVLAAAIGVGSFLFHTFATAWTRWLDVLPILLFQLAVLWIYSRRIIKFKPLVVTIFITIFVVVALYARQFSHYLNGSLTYAPAIVLLAMLAIYHFVNAKEGRHLLTVSIAVFLLSLTFRTIDMDSCAQFALGTHFMWHLLNGLLIYLVTRAVILNIDPKDPESMSDFGKKQVPVWFDSSASVTDDFQIVGRKHKLFRVIPNPYPLYDWIMGFYERSSNRDALSGPTLERTKSIVDVGVGTGYLLGQLVNLTSSHQQITAVDLSSQMLENSRNYLEKNNLLSERISFKKADCRNLPWNDGTFDLYVSSYLFDLLPENELREALKEMARILRPDGYSIIITMTTELDDVPPIRRSFYRTMNELYNFGYRDGRWNFIWGALFAGYAPHCRPIALGKYLKETDNMIIAYSKVSRVSLFPVRVWYLRKGHD